VGSTHFTAAGVAELARSTTLPDLAELELRAWIDWGGQYHPRPGLAEALTSSPLALRLSLLKLCGQALGLEGVTALARAPLRRLRRLDLSENQLGDAGLQTLLAAPWATNLRHLRLSGNEIGSDGLRRLVMPEALPRLTELDLSRNPIDAEAAAVLAASPLLSRLRRLEVRPLNAEGLRVLLTSPRLSRRTVVVLGGHDRRGLAAILGGLKDSIRCRVEVW
jgi:hypothetical protein